MANYLGAIDQGTTGTRFIVFDRSGRTVAASQKEHEQIYPQPGWVEHNAEEIWQSTREVIAEAMAKADTPASGFGGDWNHSTSARPPLYGSERLASRSPMRWFGRIRGSQRTSASWRNREAKIDSAVRLELPLTTYFSGLKIRWILEHVKGTRRAAEAGDLMFGNIDTFLVWHLTGGVHGGVHITDVTNASRTQLMNLESLSWDPEILETFGIPPAMLPEIHSSSETYGFATQPAVQDVPIAGILGDQQAALVGQTCFALGEAKNTYGTGCFLLMNTGTRKIDSKSGLLTTLAYKLGDQPAHYALEGSIAITGALVQWVRDNLGLIEKSSDIQSLARTVKDNGGVYFVPAFSGLYAPYWKDNARGVIAGLTRYANKGHIARAVEEATAFQTRDVLEAMEKDSGIKLDVLRADGGMVTDDLLMQFQADILDRPVVRPVTKDATTALGAAYAAGLAVGYFKDLDDLRANWSVDHTWKPQLANGKRDEMYRLWKRAVSKSFDWLG